jgi:CAAX prenyl protease-like protein
MEEPGASHHGWWPYVVPLGAFLALTAAEDWLPRAAGQPHPLWYPLGYGVKVAVVAGLAWAARSVWRDFLPVPGPRAIALAVALGIAVTVGWIGLERLPYPKIPIGGARQEFDPYHLPFAGRAAFLTVRLFGLVVLVPLIEELFWRSFLMRWVIDSDFAKVPVGRVTAQAAGLTSVLFAVAHPEWLPALLTGLAWSWLLARTKSLAACAISHAVANLGLGVYILSTASWRFW